MAKTVCTAHASLVGAIVCGIDDSPGAREALRVARALSDQFDARLVVAHIASRGRNGTLERAAGQDDARAERRVEPGEPAEALARIAAEEAASLIIVGSQRRGRLRPGLRSALVVELAATAPCPVVLVPPPVRR